jgi:hypothetical protein
MRPPQTWLIVELCGIDMAIWNDGHGRFNAAIEGPT